jgi:hypothetical protein
LQDIQDELPDTPGNKGSGIGLGKGDGLEADILYYMNLAQSYALPIRKRPLEKSGALYPHNYAPWEAGKPVYDINPWKSFGLAASRVYPLCGKSSGYSRNCARMRSSVFISPKSRDRTALVGAHAKITV